MQFLTRSGSAPLSLMARPVGLARQQSSTPPPCL